MQTTMVIQILRNWATATPPTHTQDIEGLITARDPSRQWALSWHHEWCTQPTVTSRTTKSELKVPWLHQVSKESQNNKVMLSNTGGLWACPMVTTPCMPKEVPEWTKEELRSTTKPQRNSLLPQTPRKAKHAEDQQLTIRKTRIGSNSQESAQDNQGALRSSRVCWGWQELIMVTAGSSCPRLSWQ